jgi:serine/threonine-protein kinase HipA
LTTKIDLDDGTCSVDLVLSAAEYFGLSLARAREIVRQTANATAGWRDVAREVGARSSEITRMASAFEHGALTDALAIRQARSRGL